MRLIRLTTDNPQAIFDNRFNADITIPKDAKIALQNISVESPNSIITITPDNNTLEYQVGNAGTVQVTLPLGTYTGNNYQDLLDAITDNLNKSANFDLTLDNRRELGIEWLCGIKSNKKVVIEYKLGDFKQYRTDPAVFDEWVNDEDLIRAVTSQGGSFSMKIGEASRSNVTANTFIRNFISRGCGFIRCRILRLLTGTSEQESGFAIGLTSKNMLNATNSDFTVADMTYGIRCKLINKGQPDEAFNYFTIVNGVETDTGTPVANNVQGDNDNDQLEVMINAGKVELNYYDKDAPPNQALVLGSEDYTAGTELFPFMVFFGDSDNVRVNLVRLTESPFSNNPKATKTLAETDGLLAPVPQRNPAPNYLQFGSQTLANYLGYRYIRYPISGLTENVVEATYPAENIFNSTLLSDAFIVLLDNIPLDSYDSYVNPAEGGLGQRKNILSVVPVSNETGAVLYEPSTPYFIDIKNNSDLMLRTIRARVVYPDYTPLSIDGLATITILIS